MLKKINQTWNTYIWLFVKVTKYIYFILFFREPKFSVDVEIIDAIQKIYWLLKFIYSQKATQFCKISTVDLTVTIQDKSMVVISRKFVAFSEYMNNLSNL